MLASVTDELKDSIARKSPRLSFKYFALEELGKTTNDLRTPSGHAPTVENL